MHHLNPLRFQYFDRYIPHWQGLTVLDVGCGGGYTCEFLARRGAIVTGIDQSRDCIVKAQAHAAEQQLTITYQHGYAEALPYADGSFDGVVCVDVLEHVADLRQTIREISRVLKPGGLFCFDTLNRTCKSKLVMIWLLEDLLREIPAGIHDWQKFIKPEELTDLLHQAGFGSIETKGFNLFGETALGTIAAYWRYRRTGGFQVRVSDDDSVMYIGKAAKLPMR